MKISQEVREFARLNPSPLAGEGGTRSPEREGEGAQANPEAPAESEAEAGMAAMSERYREGGNELYVGAGGRTHD
jgi:phosphomethylpyrimidine synthase